MQQYNEFLYEKRKELGLTKAKFAKELKINYFHYSLLENGYIKPTKKDIQKISYYFDVDYKEYTKGYASYPIEIPEKKRRKFISWIYDLIGSRWVKILLIVTSLLGVGSLITYSVLNNNCNVNSRANFDPDYLDFYDYLAKNGETTYTLFDNFKCPVIKTNEDGKLTQIRGSYNTDRPTSLTVTQTIHTDDYRLYLQVYGIREKEFKVEVEAYSYAKNLRFSSYYNYNYDLEQTNSTIIRFGDEDETEVDFLIDKSTTTLPQFLLDVQALYEEKTLQNKDFFRDILQKGAPGVTKTASINTWANILRVLGTIVLCGSLFALSYSIIYGTKKGVEKELFLEQQINSLDSETFSRKSPRTDFRIGPFIPETLIEIIGCILIFIGSFRILYYLFVILGVTTIQGNSLSSVPQEFFDVFFVGMFLLYFIDFDIFKDDKRVFRNIFMYLAIYFILYVIEITLFEICEQSESVLITQILKAPIPNMFGSITMYFLIMLFLFFTPKVLKKRWQVILYRSGAVVPIAILITSTIIFYGSNSIFGRNLDYHVRYIFASERPPFSLLCVSYLVLLYFLRLFFEKRYGKDKALNFFNGNKFIFLKNILICTLILVIGFGEYFLSNNIIAHKFEMGKHMTIVLLIPILLLYHPHKGQRNFGVDIFTNILYFLSISFVYLFIFGIIIGAFIAS